VPKIENSYFIKKFYHKNSLVLVARGHKITNTLDFKKIGEKAKKEYQTR
jgi:hypothetical protein